LVFISGEIAMFALFKALKMLVASGVAIRALMWISAAVLFAAAIAFGASYYQQSVYAKPLQVSQADIMTMLADVDPARIDHLAGPKDRLDVVFFGSADCSHCQNFVANDIAGMAREMDARGLGFAHIMLPTGVLSVAEVSARACVRGGSQDGSQDVSGGGSYDLGGVVGLYAAAAAVQAARASDDNNVRGVLSGAVGVYEAMVGGNASGPECLLAREDATEDGVAMMERFQVKGTPTFAVRGPDGVYVMLGSPTVAMIQSIAGI